MPTEYSTIDKEKFTGLNIYGFNPIEEIFLYCLGQKSLLILFSVIKERLLYSWEDFHNTLENCVSLAQ